MSILDPHEETFVFPVEVPPVIDEESKVPEYLLPDPLLSLNGEEIETTQQWMEKRRPELLELFKEHIYGTVPIEQMRQSNLATKSQIADKDENALGGKATRLQMEITLVQDDPNWRVTNKRGQMMNVLIYLPNQINGKVSELGTIPAFIGYNFEGNHTICDDPGIDLPLVWIRKDNEILRVQADESTRGSQASCWPVEKMIDSGFALMTAYYCDVVPDFPGGRKEGIQGVFDKEEKAESIGDEWGAIAAWAWGLSIIASLAALEPDAEMIDWNKVAVFGHSRLGKTALWAGAMDQRFALVISNNSGCGGAALSRREFGETIFRMNTVFPHWLCGNAKQYNARINDCPVDQHELIALIAPRPIYVASATEDSWADPKGEFLSCLHADPVYKFLGTEGLGDATQMPAPDTPVGKTIQYHNRTGAHDITEYDWDLYLRFAKEQFGDRE